MMSTLLCVSHCAKFLTWVQFSSLQSLRPHELQHAKPPCPSPTPRVYPSPCPLSRWCHPTISSSVVPFSSCPQSFPASGSFPMSQLFTSGGQVLKFQLQHHSFQWTPRTDLLYDGLVGPPCSPRDSQKSSPIPHQFFSAQLSSQWTQVQFSSVTPLCRLFATPWITARMCHFLWNSDVSTSVLRLQI